MKLPIIDPQDHFYVHPPRLTPAEVALLQAKASELEMMLMAFRALHSEVKDELDYRADDELDEYARQICRELLRAVNANGLGGCRLCRS